MPLGTRAASDHSDFCADAIGTIWFLLMANCCREVKALLHVHTPQYRYIPVTVFSLFLSFWTCSEASCEVLYPTSGDCPISQHLWKCNFVVWMWHCLLLYIWGIPVHIGKLAQLTILFFFGIAQPRHETCRKHIIQTWIGFRITTVEDGAFWEALRCYAAYQSLVSAHVCWVYSINIFKTEFFKEGSWASCICRWLFITFLYCYKCCRWWRGSVWFQTMCHL